jgi:hypothetical protein
MRSVSHLRAVMRIGLAAVLTITSFAADSANNKNKYGFQVLVTLSPRATALLRNLHEGIVVAAYYEGYPIPSKVDQAGEMGQIGFGTERILLSGNGEMAEITGHAVDPVRASWVRIPSVLVNVFSARRSGPNNLLDCGIFEDTIAKAKSAPIKIECGLISEQPTMP